ncbi:LamG domain-containing protein [Streptomyces abikoensis]|uniref:LamG domain-containing protein n=1 Tax=Streptomyces abikoensis TaxID=97398 RepID=UPI0034090B9E
MAQAKRSGRTVEVMSQRSESSDVFAKPDGTFEVREYLHPIRTRVDGQWKAIDTTLIQTADGAVAPKAAAVGLRLSGGGDAPLVRMGRAGRQLGLSWSGRLPAPRLDGDTATYPDVLPDVDLKVSAKPDGFTHLFVVKSAKAAANPELDRLRMKVATEGMEIRQTPSGGAEAVDKGSGGAVFEAPSPMMWDSGHQPEAASATNKSQQSLMSSSKAAEAIRGGRAAADEAGKLGRVGLAVPPGGSELVLTPDKKVLTGPGTVYPVFIDPHWYSPKASAWTMVSKYWADTPQWKFNGDSDAGMGYCDWNHCNPGDTKRLIYEVPTGRFAGKSILSAEFVVRETWSASCSAKGVQLWLTRGISSSTTWNSSNSSGFWAEKLDEGSFAHGYEGCAADDAEFNVRAAVQKAADHSWNDITVGLRASDEDDTYAWKRFSDKAYLRVNYNQPPGQISMSQLTMEYGGACKRSEEAVRVRSLGKIYASGVTDPDGDDVAVEFVIEWNDGKTRWKSGLTGYKKSGSDFAMDLPSNIPQNTVANWYVRSYDGANYSPWSWAGDPSGCFFIRDSTAPSEPKVASGDYPESRPADPQDPWYDGVGRYGAFVLGPASKDVTQYWYGINGDPSASNTVQTSGGEARTIRVLPTQPGVNFVTVKAIDSAGNASAPHSYQFRVNAGQPERAVWKMDEGPEAQQAEGAAPARTAELHGGVSTGADGVLGRSLSLNGTDAYASTDVPVVDTGRSFTVAAWAKLASIPGEAAVIAAQPGNQAPGFELYYSKDYDRWAFNQYASDTAGALPVRVMQKDPGGAKAGEWAHVAGVYDSVAGELRLFVNGRQEGAVPYKNPWDARRGLQIGAGSYGSKRAAFFPGQIDELEIFDRSASADEIKQLFAKNRLRGPGRPARAVFPFDEDAGAKEVTGRTDVMPAVFHGGPKAGEAGVDGKALSFDGIDDYATVGAPQFNTAAGFAVSLWARLPKDKPTHTSVLITQAGANASGAELYYSSSYDRWVFNQHTSDVKDPVSNKVVQSAGTAPEGGEWAHLVGVHDPVARTLTLYVNGIAAGSVPLTAPWTAEKQLQIGAGSYGGTPGNFFSGEIDDIRLYDRPVSAGEVQQLFRQRPMVKGRWRLDKATGTPPVSPDSVTGGRNLALIGGASIGSGWVDTAGLALDGLDDAASTTGVPVDTSGSFTVSAWAQAAPQQPDHAMTVMSAEGAKQSAFTVRYLPAAKGTSGIGHWQVALASEDTDRPGIVTTVDNDAFSNANAWNHLALSYDGFTNEARLYVNGHLQALVCAGGNDGKPDDASCTGHTSRADHVTAFNATRSLQLGRVKTATGWGEYWAGGIDDVWAFQGTLTEQQVAMLAAGWPDFPTAVPGES